MEIKPVAVFYSSFCSKFGIPKQSGIVGNLRGKIVFVPEFRNPDALRGMEEFEYLWLVWEFSANRHGETSLMVRPPRLGGNKKVGVFASRSPFRPNSLGLSSVRIDHIEWETACGPIIHVLGADLMNGTPIYDIKPYVTYADSHPEARSGFVDRREWKRLKVEIPSEVKERLMGQDGMTDESIMQLQEVLAEDPRPQYQKDPQKVYGMPFEGLDIHFCVDGDCLTVI